MIDPLLAALGNSYRARARERALRSARSPASRRRGRTVAEQVERDD